MRDETELVMIVTPHLVQPLGSAPVPLPGDDYVDPTRWDLLKGRIEGTPPDDLDATDAIKRSSLAPRDGSDKDVAGGLIGDFGHRLRIPRPTAGQGS
jgi:Flp pilus assembly secretin CpaC